mmetsp:Transcript_17621/g.40383  ORF Transcript_17621/g.40383 Transcript_17621/m.40383 type:complete len:130 (-) Transcript_17621:335-724(-)
MEALEAATVKALTRLQHIHCISQSSHPDNAQLHAELNGFVDGLDALRRTKVGADVTVPTALITDFLDQQISPDEFMPALTHRHVDAAQKERGRGAALHNLADALQRQAAGAAFLREQTSRAAVDSAHVE